MDLANKKKAFYIAIVIELMKDFILIFTCYFVLFSLVALKM